MSGLLSRTTAAFSAAFGGAPDLVARAPGRVNLIGEHTDYNDGFVLPVAISRQNLVAARRRSDGQVCVHAADLNGAVSHFALDGPIAPDAAQPWSNYVRGMALSMRDAGYPIDGADLTIAGTIPRGSGLSSSASLCVASGTALAALAGQSIDPTRMAELAKNAENNFVGTHCGIMDQLASACGEKGHALLIDCRSLAVQTVAIPEGFAILIVHSGVTRGLVEGHYNQRRAQCEEAARILDVPALRDADMARLEATRRLLDPLTFARSRHVISENARTLAAAEALTLGDLSELGHLMAASHQSMRDDFAITVPPVDALVSELQSLIGDDGGARMTGGGFGGAVVALLPRERVGDVIGRLSYRTPAGERPEIMIETPSAGASIL